MADKKEKKVEKAKEEKVKPVVTEAKAYINNLKLTPRKARLIIDLIRGKDVDSALAILKNVNKIGAKDIYKLVYSCKSNATNNFGFKEDLLYIDTIFATDGIKMKRTMPRAKGSASGKVKRNSRVTVVIKERK